MAKNVELTHAEVVPFYKSDQCLREKEIEGKGIILNFQVKVKVNDQAEKSPFLFEKCSQFVSGEDLDKMRRIIKNGSIIDIKGTEERQSFENKQGETIWFNQIKVRGIIPISESSTESAPVTDDDLPF